MSCELVVSDPFSVARSTSHTVNCGALGRTEDAGRCSTCIVVPVFGCMEFFLGAVRVVDIVLDAQ